jgi:hypothetical protein
VSHGVSKFGLIIVDIPKGLQISKVSSPLGHIFSLEQVGRMPYQSFVDFAHSYLHNNAGMHLIISSIKGVRGDVMNYP